MRLDRLLAALAGCAVLLAGSLSTLQAADFGVEEGLTRYYQVESQKVLDGWAKSRAADIDRLVRRGATPAEAAAALDERQRLGAEDIVAQRVPIRQTTPLLGLLEERLAILQGVAALPHQRLVAVLKQHGMAPTKGFYDCLCTGGFWYAPSEYGPCESYTHAYVNVIHAPFVESAEHFAICAAAFAGETGGDIARQLVEKVRTMRKTYEQDVCARLAEVIEAVKALRDSGGLKPLRDSAVASGRWERSFMDLLLGTQTDGVLEALLSGLSDRFALGVGLADLDKPTGLGVLLTHQDKPSTTGLANPYIFYTKVLTSEAFVVHEGQGLNLSFEMELARRILQAPGPLAPRDLFRLAVETTNGDLPLAMLVAHNLLKEAAYAERGQTPMVLARIPKPLLTKNAKERALKEGYARLFGGDGQFAGRDFIMDPALIRQRLQDIRPYYDPQIADRLGPWYHSFGLLFVGSNPVLGENFAYSGAAIENATRLLGLGSTRSLGKEAANRCAVQLVEQINALLKAP